MITETKRGARRTARSMLATSAGEVPPSAGGRTLSAETESSKSQSSATTATMLMETDAASGAESSPHTLALATSARSPRVPKLQSQSLLAGTKCSSQCPTPADSSSSATMATRPAAPTAQSMLDGSVHPVQDTSQTASKYTLRSAETER